MSIVGRGLLPGALHIRGKLGKAGQPDPENLAGIYQVRRRGNDFIQVKEKFYAPTGEPSDAQVAQRAKMRLAVAGWQALSSHEKQNYNLLAQSYHFSGYNLYLSRKIKTL